MKLEMIGLSHAAAALETRQKAAIGPDRIALVANRLLEHPHVDGVVILSTCNRVELYLSPQLHLPEAELRSAFAEIGGLNDAERDACYVRRDHYAALHLFRVASGLESQMLGEVQILVQVKDAYHTALELACTNGVLNTLFLRAIECGKLVRHRTGISQGAVSVAYAAVDVASRVYRDLSKHNILLVGAGDTTRLAAKYLKDFGATNWRISNRTRERAESFAEEIEGCATSFPPTPEDLEWADLAVCATSAPQPVITSSCRETLERKKQPTLFLDLAVPCDVDASLKEIENVYLYTVDDFEEMVAENLKAREKEAERAAKLVNKQVEEFVTWYRGNRVAPTMQQLQEVLETIRSTEVQRNAKRFLPEDREQVDEFSKALMRKVTSLIVANMKRASLDRNDLSLARAVSMAFAPTDSGAVEHIIKELDHELSH